MTHESTKGGIAQTMENFPTMKKKLTADAYNNMGKPQKCNAKLKKPDAKSYI